MSTESSAFWVVKICTSDIRFETIFHLFSVVYLSICPFSVDLFYGLTPSSLLSQIMFPSVLFFQLLRFSAMDYVVCSVTVPVSTPPSGEYPVSTAIFFRL